MCCVEMDVSRRVCLPRLALWPVISVSLARSLLLSCLNSVSGLGRLIVLYDDNHITIDGSTDLSFSEDVIKRFEAYGWHTQIVADGDHDTISEAIKNAKAVTDRPSIIKVHNPLVCLGFQLIFFWDAQVRTTIGLGSKIQGTGKVHGSPLGDEDLGNVKRKYGFDPEKKFVVEPEVLIIQDSHKCFFIHSIRLLRSITNLVSKPLLMSRAGMSSLPNTPRHTLIWQLTFHEDKGETFPLDGSPSFLDSLPRTPRRQLVRYEYDHIDERILTLLNFSGPNKCSKQ